MESAGAEKALSGVTEQCSAVKINPGATAHAHGVEVDIDGVPIRGDGIKVDLKQILGHMPQVDDDDDDATSDSQVTHRGVGQNLAEEGGAAAALIIQSQFEPIDYDDLEYGGDSEEYEVEPGDETTGRRKRRSSLKKLLRVASDHSTLPPEEPDSDDDESPLSPDHSRKAVRFADAIGLGLADVRDLVNADEPPQVPASALKDLHIRRRKRSKSQLIYQLDFDQPGSDPSFIQRVLADKVALENCICNLQPGPSASSPEQLTISGVIRVANVAFDKRVFVRFTVDGWRKGGTEYDVAATYLPGSNDGATDRFAFVMQPPDGSMQAPGTRLEFAVAFDAAGTLFWDSNAGANYGVDCTAGDQSPSSPTAGQAVGQSA